MGAVKEKKLVLVVLGFVVKKTWKDKDGKYHDKTISKRFSSREAAEVFRRLAEKTRLAAPAPQGEDDTQIYVTDDVGVDGLPAGR